MVEPKGSKLTSGDICCVGISHMGIALATIIAHTCPSLNVTVVDLDPVKITLWNTKQMTCRDPQMEEMLRIAQNRNLIFTTKMESSLKAADIVIISIDTSTKDSKKLLDLSGVEETVRLIAKYAESKKVIVLKSVVPVGTHENLQQILLANKSNNVDLQLLSVPDFLSEGDVITSLRHPHKVLIGSDMSEAALEAAETLESLYNCWVPPERIKKLKSNTVELTKIVENAFLAQKLISFSALSIASEHAGGDVKELVKILGKDVNVYGTVDLGFGGSCLKRYLKSLVDLCEQLHLSEVADYWREVLVMNDYCEKKFLKKILSSFFNNLINKKITVWGLAMTKSAESPNGGLAIDFLMSLAEEGATLSLWDPTMEGRAVLSELKAAGIEEDKVTFCEDPYKAALKSNGIVVLMDRPELEGLDYSFIQREMVAPACIFDGRACLPREKLTEIGFVVKTVGKPNAPDALGYI